MKFFVLLFLGIVFLPIASAGNIQNSQKRASTAYEQMKAAKYEAELSAKDTTEAENKVQRIKQQLSKAEQKAEAARKKLKEANLKMEQAINNWNNTSNALAREWEKSKRQ